MQYDRSAIQRWLSKHDTSPKVGDSISVTWKQFQILLLFYSLTYLSMNFLVKQTGQPLTHKSLVENHNLKRLIGDLVDEGGLGLYTKSQTSDGRRRALVQEQLLILRCVESSSQEQNGITYHVSQSGAEGGRSRKSDALNRSFIQLLDDATVSRRHFHISFNEGAGGGFQIRDLGSGSGVQLRINYESGHSLALGDIICLGKHQLLVTEGDRQKLKLRCTSPSGSPLENKEFCIGQEGAILGRRQTCDVSFTTEVEGKIMGIDSAISMSHARIESFFDEAIQVQRFVILDGSEDRPSSNGTWLRLSQMHQSSRDWPLDNGAELVIGSSRFKVNLDKTVSESEMKDDQ